MAQFSKNVGGAYGSSLHNARWCFIFVQNFMKIFQRVSELLSGHDIMTDGLTDGQGHYYTGSSNIF